VGKRFKQRKFYRLNRYIQADEVRVVDEKGKQIGVMPLNKALQQAQEKGLDLVEIAAKAKPPVCKIIDFKKFKFLEAKKEQQERKKTKKVELKEIRLAPFIAENDFNFRIKKAEDFLKEGNKVKVVVRFRGRQMTKKEFGYDLLKKAVERLRPFAKVDIEPRFVGRRLEMAFSPIKGGQSGQKQDENKKVD
jgi:translation initiation factor IF-3